MPASQPPASGGSALGGLPPGTEVAGLGRRLGAIAIDWAASLLVASLLLRAGFGQDLSLLPLAVFAVEVTILTWLTSSSFGQRLLGIVVVRLDGSRLGLGRAALRTLLICLVIPAVVYDSEGRGLHDRAVGSVALTRARPR